MERASKAECPASPESLASKLLIAQPQVDDSPLLCLLARPRCPAQPGWPCLAWPSVVSCLRPNTCSS